MSKSRGLSSPGLAATHNLNNPMQAQLISVV